MKPILLATCLIATAAFATQPLPRAEPGSVGISSDRLGRISTTMQTYVDHGRLSGSVVLIARRGKVVYEEAFGFRDRESRDPLRTDSLFRIASQTKALVSVGIMMLAEEGRLTLTDPVSQYIPEFRETTVAIKRDDGGYDVAKAQREITLRDLLTHTSGIGYGNGIAADRWREAGIQNWYFADRGEPMSAIVSRMAKLPMDAQPGTAWVYGYSTDILGVVIERVSGQSLEAFLTARILTPLGMTDTRFFVPPAQRNRLAVVYSAADDGDNVTRAPDPGTGVGQGAYIAGPRKAFSGGAGLVSSAQDYARFLLMMMNGGTLDGARLLGRKSVELITADHLDGLPFEEDGVGFGLGFYVVADVGARGVLGSEGEFGWGGAYHSTYWVDPKEQLVVVYMTQLIPPGDLDDHEKLRTLVYQALQD